MKSCKMEYRNGVAVNSAVNLSGGLMLYADLFN